MIATVQHVFSVTRRLFFVFGLSDFSSSLLEPSPSFACVAIVHCVCVAHLLRRRRLLQLFTMGLRHQYFGSIGGGGLSVPPLSPISYSISHTPPPLPLGSVGVVQDVTYFGFQMFIHSSEIDYISPPPYQPPAS